MKEFWFDFGEDDQGSNCSDFHPNCERCGKRLEHGDKFTIESLQMFGKFVHQDCRFPQGLEE